MKKGLLPLILGVVLIVAAVVAPIPVFISLMQQDEDEVTFMVPSEQTVHASEPGKYYLWNDHSIIFEGEVFSLSEDLPHGLKISISDEDENQLNFVSDTSISTSSGNSSKKSIGYVEVTQPQELLISVSNTSEQRIFSFAQSRFKEFFTRIMLIFAIGFGGVVGGIALIVTGVIKRNKSKKVTPPTIPLES